MRRRFKTTNDRVRMVMVPFGKRFMEDNGDAAIEHALATARKHNPGFRVASFELMEWSAGTDCVVIVNVKMVRTS